MWYIFVKFWIVLLSEFIDMATRRKGESHAPPNLIHTFARTIIERASDFLYLIERSPQENIVVAA